MERVMSKIKKSEKCIYELFNFIDKGSLTVINPHGKKFKFGKEGSSPSLCIHIQNYKTYELIISLAAQGLCEAYTKGWWLSGAEKS